MISLDVKHTYPEDLYDDVADNVELHLYDFLKGDVVKAFYFGFFFSEWIPHLQASQIRLYSRELRHTPDNLDKYSAQLDYWNSTYFNKFKGESVSIVHYPEYILNNVILDSETEARDMLDLALILGKNVSTSKAKQESKEVSQEDSNNKELEYV